MNTLLSRLYDSAGDFYLLTRDDGAFIIEGKEDQDPPRDPPENVLRLFASPGDVKEYRSRAHFKGGARISKTKLIELWPLLERLNKASQKSFQCPIAVEVSGINARGDVVTVEKLHGLSVPVS